MAATPGSGGCRTWPVTGVAAAHNQHEHEAHRRRSAAHLSSAVPQRTRPVWLFSAAFLAAAAVVLVALAAPCARLARRPCCLGIIPFDFLFLPEPGHRVFHRLRHFRVVSQGFLVDVLRIGGNGLFLGLGLRPVGFELMTPDAAADGFSRLALGKFFSLMAASTPTFSCSTSWIFPCRYRPASSIGRWPGWV